MDDYRAVFEAALEGMAIYDDAWVCREANPAFCALLGASAETLIGRDHSEYLVDLVQPEHRFTIWAERPATRNEARLRRLDGEIRSVEYSLVMNIVPQRHLVILRDISARRALEAELRREALEHSQVVDAEFALLLTRLVRLGNELALATDADELCRLTVEKGIRELGFERMAIWLLDDDPNFVRGTYGTDEAGKLRDERARRQPFAEHPLLHHLLACPQEPFHQQNILLYNDRHVAVGIGTAGAAALWNGSRVVGSLNVDNFVTGKEYADYHWRVLQLYAAMVGHLLMLKQTEMALRDKEDLLTRVLNLLPLGVSLHGPDNRVEQYNPAMLRVWGVDAPAGPAWEGIRGVRVADGRPVARDEWAGAAALKRGEPVMNLEIEALCADGARRVIVSSALPLRDARGQINGAVVIDQDMTEWKRREQELAALAARLQLVMDAASFGLVLLDQDRRVILANRSGQAYLEQLGVLAADGVVTQLAGHRIEEWLPGVVGDAGGCEDEGTANVTMEFTVDARIFEVSATCIRTEKSEIGWLLVLHDVTTARSMQEGIRQHERMAAVGQLAAGIAHDFNNILGVILLYIQMIQRSAKLDDVNAARLNVIREQAQTAGQLVRQILDFSRQTVMERRPVDLTPLVKEMMKLWQRTLPENLQFVLETAGDVVCRVAADPVSLQQVLTNLVVNARDAMPDGGRITVILRPVEVMGADTPGVPPGKWVYLAVRDTGVGIAPTHLPYVFEPFFTTKEVGKGTGLGLAQAYGIVRQHHGVITAESEVGKGTTIAIYLPALAVEQAADEAPESVEVVPAGSETVMLVEDNRAVREATAAILEMMGYRVVQAANGQEGLARYRAESERLALVISDMMMPGMDGLELIQQIRAINPTARVLMITGYPLEDNARLWLEQGKVVWLQKPFAVRELMERVRAVLDGQQSEGQVDANKGRVAQSA